MKTKFFNRYMVKLFGIAIEPDPTSGDETRDSGAAAMRVDKVRGSLNICNRKKGDQLQQGFSTFFVSFTLRIRRN
jgi:hypothetical protein